MKLPRDEPERSIALAALPRFQALRLEAPPKAATCVLCNGPIEPYDWRARLPEGAGPAHGHCAGDHGFEVT